MKNSKYWTVLLSLSVLATLLHGQEVLPKATIIQEDVLNSINKESNISLTADRLTIYFSSRRGGQKWNQGDSDIYYSIRFNTAGTWSTPIPLPLTINDELDQDEVFISADGVTLTYQHWQHDWQKKGGPYYQTKWGGNKEWETPPSSLGGNITEFFKKTINRATDGMTRLMDGSLVFAAGKDMNQPMDLYYAKFVSKDAGFLYPKPLICNTKYDERSLFIAPDGQSLYFASNRPGGYGGMDIYKAIIREDGTITDVVNIGPPINTAANESGLVIYDTYEGYFLRNEDIYRIKNPDFSLVPVRPNPDSSSQREVPLLVIPDSMLTEDVQLPETMPGPNLNPEPKYIPNNIVFLLDISSSMKDEDKLPLMVGAIRKSLKYFFRRDKVSVITFSDSPKLILNGVDGDQRVTITTALTGLTPQGETKTKPGLEEAKACAKSHLIEKGKNIVVLATDGRLNFAELKPLGNQLNRKGVEIILFLYGLPTSSIEAKANDFVKSVEGKHYWIQPQNIDSTLEEVLNLALRKN